MSSEEAQEMSPVNLDGEPLVELEVGADTYRLDPALGGSTLGLSRRGPGSWSWQFIAEVRWDGSSLRSKAVERGLLEELGRALALASLDQVG
jgi:hypothetical protein